MRPPRDLAVVSGRTCGSSCMRLQILLPSTRRYRSTWAGSRLETVATSTPAALPHWSDSPATSLHRLSAAAVHANSRIPLQCLGHAAIRPRLYRPYGIAITDEASPPALRSTRNRLIPYGGLAVKVEAGSA